MRLSWLLGRCDNVIRWKPQTCQHASQLFCKIFHSLLLELYYKFILASTVCCSLQHIDLRPTNSAPGCPQPLLHGSVRGVRSKEKLITFTPKINSAAEFMVSPTSAQYFLAFLKAATQVSLLLQCFSSSQVTSVLYPRRLAMARPFRIFVQLSSFSDANNPWERA